MFFVLRPIHLWPRSPGSGCPWVGGPSLPPPSCGAGGVVPSTGLRCPLFFCGGGRFRAGAAVGLGGKGGCTARTSPPREHGDVRAQGGSPAAQGFGDPGLGGGGGQNNVLGASQLRGHLPELPSRVGGTRAALPAALPARSSGWCLRPGGHHPSTSAPTPEAPELGWLGRGLTGRGVGGHVGEAEGCNSWGFFGVGGRHTHTHLWGPRGCGVTTRGAGAGGGVVHKRRIPRIWGMPGAAERGGGER